MGSKREIKFYVNIWYESLSRCWWKFVDTCAFVDCFFLKTSVWMLVDISMCVFAIQPSTSLGFSLSASYFIGAHSFS